MASITYIGIVRDHSASMTSLRSGASNDYNLTIDGIKQSVLDEGQPALVSVVECGVGPLGKHRVVEEGVPAGRLQHVVSYSTNGSATPLWDSVGSAIHECQQAAKRNGDTDNEEAAFLIMVITDGQENRSQQWTAESLSREIRRLQGTDRWTFVFRVPRGYKNALTRLGIPDGNVMEWEQSEAALSVSTQATVSGVQTFFKARSAGQRSSSSFYTDTSNLTKAEVKQTLTEITHGLSTVPVPSSENGIAIREFCMANFGGYNSGAGFYQLTKPEKVQGHKRIVIRETDTGRYYSGASARRLLGLPEMGDVRVVPQNGGKFDIFVQSTSFTRKLVGGTTVLYMNGQ